ncbi:MAG: hypothetical protein HQK55_13705, partial [Deltaproteobacteria bacterium]|nr:hypothetical protein [Deltaproteobacteria bacterium]
AFGATLVDIDNLRTTVNGCLLGRPVVSQTTQGSAAIPTSPPSKIAVISRVEVEYAFKQGMPLRISRGTVITPLARELAQQRQVEILED